MGALSLTLGGVTRRGSSAAGGWTVGRGSRLGSCSVADPSACCAFPCFLDLDGVMSSVNTGSFL